MEADLASLGEDGLIHRLCQQITPGPDLLVGPGDDCAVLRSPRPGEVLLFKTDAVIEGVHFHAGTDPGRVGWKAAARVVSDFAAMGGGEPRHALVSLFVTANRTAAWLERLYQGLQRCASRFGFDVAGGETGRLPDGSPGCLVSIALLGRLEQDRCLLRSGARPGDALWVTGRLGGSLASGKHLDFEPRMEAARRLSASGTVHALMDLSDGLARDLPRLAKASGAGFRLHRDAVPITPGCSLAQALGDGEDYELLFAMPPGTIPPLDDAAQIGELVPPSASDHLAGGWDHFA